MYRVYKKCVFLGHRWTTRFIQQQQYTTHFEEEIMGLHRARSNRVI